MNLLFVIIDIGSDSTLRREYQEKGQTLKTDAWWIGSTRWSLGRRRSQTCDEVFSRHTTAGNNMTLHSSQRPTFKIRIPLRCHQTTGAYSHWWTKSRVCRSRSILWHRYCCSLEPFFLSEY